MAWGDLAASLAALVASVALLVPGTRSRWAVWGFFVVALGDNVVSAARAALVDLFPYELGFSALITVLYVPALFVSYVLIVLLMRRDTERRGLPEEV
jgi:hypothetical protein